VSVERAEGSGAGMHFSTSLPRRTKGGVRGGRLCCSIPITHSDFWGLDIHFKGAVTALHVMYFEGDEHTQGSRHIAYINLSLG